MDLTFHYYVIKLLCLGVGITEPEAEIIAHASNHVDENIDWFTVDKGRSTEFPTVASFSIDTLKQKDDTYPTLLMHFVPGDGAEKGLPRNDGKWFPGLTTPDATMARDMVNAAVRAHNPYALGVALHTYADTWAHQGFAGCKHDLNEMPNTGLWRILPSVGHGEAGHLPDWPVKWQDGRLQDASCEINNKERFMAAAKKIVKILYRYANPTSTNAEDRRGITQPVLEKIEAAWGNPIPIVERASAEIERLEQEQTERLRALGRNALFGGHELHRYDLEKYQRDALVVAKVGFDDGAFKRFFKGVLPDFFPDKYYWQRAHYARAAAADRQKHQNSSFPSPFDVVTLFEEPTGGTKYFEVFKPLGAAESTVPVVAAIENSGFYRFQQGVQTQMARFTTETRGRMVDDGRGNQVPLYTYYDPGQKQRWVGQMEVRTEARRASLFPQTPVVEAEDAAE